MTSIVTFDQTIANLNAAEETTIEFLRNFASEPSSPVYLSFLGREEAKKCRQLIKLGLMDRCRDSKGLVSYYIPSVVWARL